MAPTKKRKEPPQSSTLLKFFSGAGEPKGKLLNREPPTKAKRVVPITQDIIILDSDDDQFTPKPRASPTSSDMIVEDEPTKVTCFETADDLCLN